METPARPTSESPRPKTYFAPAERASPEALQEAIEAVSGHPLMTAALRSFSGIILVLNPERQILAVNHEVLRLLGCEEPDRALGLRPGEALQCVHAHDNPEGGCGTSRFCSTCGAAIAIVASQSANGPAEAECLLTLRADGHDESAEFKVKAAPMEVEGRQLLIVSLHDIRDQKRKQALESVFFHDVTNVVTALSTVARLIPRSREDERPELIRTLGDLADRVVTEIVDQRDLALIEEGRFEAHKALVLVRDIFEALARLFASDLRAEGKTLTFVPDNGDLRLRTFRVLLRRALTNMVKNALEATPKGGEVRVWADAVPGRVVFRVWNPTAMSSETALRVFQRYFSTKGEPGRGLGTYGMKLLCERYLGGRVSFTTSRAEGTTFRLEVPLGDVPEPA